MTADLIQAWAEAEKARYGGGEFWDGIIDMCADWRAMQKMLRRVSGDCACTEHSQWASNVLDNLKVKP